MNDDEIYRPPIVVNCKRPAYQTAQDTDHERMFCERVNNTSSLNAQRIRKKLFPCDIVLEREKKIVAFVEYKYRFGALGYTEGVILSLEKLTRLIELSGAGGVPALFAIENSPGDYYVATLKRVYGIQFGGRRDRGDAADMEPVAMIPRADFVPLADFLKVFQQ